MVEVDKGESTVNALKLSSSNRSEPPERNPEARGSRAGLARLVVSDAAFIVLFAAGAILRIITQLAYHPALLLQRDAYSYLAAAYDTHVTGFRPLLYPLVLKPLLAFDSLSVVPMVQHAIVLGLAFLLYLLMKRLGIHPTVAALGTAPLLLDAYQLDIEQYILSEVFFDLCVVAALALMLWWKTPPMWALGVAGALIGVSALVRFVGVAIIVPLFVYALLARIGWRRIVVLVVVFALPLAIYATWFRSAAGSFSLTDRNGFILYGRVVEFAGCTGLDVPSDQREFCPDPGLRLDPTRRGLWESGLPVARLTEDPTANARILSFSLRVIRARPLDYLSSVGLDIARYFRADQPVAREAYAQRWIFVRTLEEADPHPLVLKYRGAPPPEAHLEESFTIDRSLAGFLGSYQSVVYTWGPLVALMLILGLAGGLVGAPGVDGRVRPSALLFVLAALALLLLPTLVGVYHFRYVLTTLPLVGPGAAIGGTALAARLRLLRPDRG